MKTLGKLFFTCSYLLLACDATHAMEVEETTQQDPQFFHLDIDQMNELITLTFLVRAIDLQIPVDNHPITMEATWNDPEAVFGIRAVILDVCAGLAKFYYWAFRPLFVEGRDRLIPRIENNSLVLQFHKLLLQTRVIMHLAHQFSPVPQGLFQEDDKFWNVAVDVEDDALKDFAGEHVLTEVVNDALIKIFTLRQYLIIVNEKTDNFYLRHAISEAFTISKEVARLLNFYSDGNFIARHLCPYQPPSTDQDTPADDSSTTNQDDV